MYRVGWLGGALVLGILPVPGRPTIWMTVGQGLTALAVGAEGGCLDIFTLVYSFSPLSPSLWETARYRLKYCLKGPLNPKQPTNQLMYREHVQICNICNQMVKVFIIIHGKYCKFPVNLPYYPYFFFPIIPTFSLLFQTVYLYLFPAFGRRALESLPILL